MTAQQPSDEITGEAPDFVLEVQAEQDLSDQQAAAALVDASKLVTFLSRYGCKKFVWQWGHAATDGYYDVTVEIDHPVGVEDQREIIEYAQSIGALLVLFSCRWINTDVITTWDARFDSDEPNVLMPQDIQAAPVMVSLRFPVLALPARTKQVPQAGDGGEGDWRGLFHVEHK